jgi:hypothetical protein
LCSAAIAKKVHFANRRKVNYQLEIQVDDVTERDNSTLALAAARIEPALADLFDRNLIDEPTYLLLFHEMLGKDYDTTGPQPKGKKAPLTKQEQPTTIADPAEPEPTDQAVDATE